MRMGDNPLTGTGLKTGFIHFSKYSAHLQYLQFIPAQNLSHSSSSPSLCSLQEWYKIWSNMFFKHILSEIKLFRTSTL
jgi:hypothetical protein